MGFDFVIEEFRFIEILTGALSNPHPLHGICLSAHDGVGVVPVYIPLPQTPDLLP